MSLQSLSAELVGTVPGLALPLAQTYVQRAWRDICDVKRWSFLQAQGAIVCPVQITAGSAAFTTLTTSVTLSSAASTAFLALPLSLQTAVQIRFNGGPLYRILAASAGPSVTLTLDRLIEEATATASPYQIYRAYLQNPGSVLADFKAWTSLDDFVNGIRIVGSRLTQNRSIFDRKDPQRQAQGQAYYVGWYQADSAGNPIYELWPHPVQGQTWLAGYVRRSTTLVAPTDVQPDQIPDDLIVQRALGWYGYPWAHANQGRVPELGMKGLNFLALATATQKTYREALQTVKMGDDERALTSVVDRGRAPNGNPLEGLVADADFWQQHAITW